MIDGEILPWKDGAPLPFAQLQRRIGRKTLGKKILAEVPVVLMAYDLLEYAGRDVRDAAAGLSGAARLEALASAVDRRRSAHPLADGRGATRGTSWPRLARGAASAGSRG